MPYDYSIKPPCSSAQPMRNSDPTSPSFGEVIQPIRYNGVGCPAVILNTSNMFCKNGSIFNPISARAPCNERNTKSDCGVTFFDNVPCDWNEGNATCKSASFVNIDNLKFRTNEIVYVEDVLSNIKKILSPYSLTTFLSWNPGLLDDLANISRGCGSGSNLKLKGRIKAITNYSFGDGIIKWGDMEFYRNTEYYPNGWVGYCEPADETESESWIVSDKLVDLVQWKNEIPSMEHWDANEFLDISRIIQELK